MQQLPTALFFCLTVGAVLYAEAAANCQWNGYDLSSLNQPGTDYSLTSGGQLYKLQICGTVSEAKCAAKNGALCNYTPNPPTLLKTLSLWDSTGSWSQIDPYQPALGVQVTFTNGDACPSGGSYAITYQFPCGQQGPATSAYTIAATSTCSYMVKFQNMASCKGGSVQNDSKGGLSGGSVFLIIFFVGGFVYVVAGCLYKRQKMGASGIESCPNIDLWRELPGLVGDGFKFTWAKIKACTNGGASGGGGGYETVK